MSAAAVLARGLAVGYGGEAIVTGLDLELPAGAALSLLGTNGAGKSTLLRTLAGLLPPVAGSVSVLGARPGGSPARVAYLGQLHPRELALSLRVCDVVAMGRFPERGLLGRLSAADRLTIAEAIERMGIAALADAPLSALSGGQRQRAYLARTLAWGADLLLLDEPDSGLDLAGHELLARALAEERRRGVAVVVCTHDVADALSADQALLLAQRVVAYGRPGDVLTEEGLRETFGLLLTAVPGGDALTMDPGHRHGTNGGAP